MAASSPVTDGDVSARSAGATLPKNTMIAVNEDGMYGWRGSVDMGTNPTIALLYGKIAAFSIGALLVIMIGIAIAAGVDPSAMLVLFGIGLGVCVLIAVIVVVVYLIYRAYLGGTYSADYLMDETGFVFRPAPKEERFTVNVAAGAAIIAALAGNYGVTVAGIAATNTEAATRFKSVFRVKGIRKHNVIKVSEPFLYNQVYVAPQDYDFVYRFICERCPKAKCVEK